MSWSTSAVPVICKISRVQFERCSLCLFRCFHQHLIHLHQLRYASTFAVIASPKAVCLHDGPIILLVGLAQLRGHSNLVIEISKAAIGIEGAGIQNGLGGLLDFCLLCACRCRPGEVVTDKI